VAEHFQVVAGLKRSDKVQPVVVREVRSDPTQEYLQTIEGKKAKGKPTQFVRLKDEICRLKNTYKNLKNMAVTFT
jgi:hypothetical protein